ncbi:MAG TPA: hypothetical protein VMT67_01360 [Terriglobales bacterium]|nr:hypothetical protein [Terriglobales bacterium]
MASHRQCGAGIPARVCHCGAGARAREKQAASLTYAFALPRRSWVAQRFSAAVHHVFQPAALAAEGALHG